MKEIIVRTNNINTLSALAIGATLLAQGNSSNSYGQLVTPPPPPAQQDSVHTSNQLLGPIITEDKNAPFFWQDNDAKLPKIPFAVEPTPPKSTPPITATKPEPIQAPTKFTDEQLAQISKLIKESLSSSNSSSKNEEIEKLVREAVRDEVLHAPMSTLAKVLLGITALSFVYGTYGYLRGTRKAKLDFEQRKRDREELLFGNQGLIVEEPKQLLITESPSPIQGEKPIYEADDPRIEQLTFDYSRDLGPYSFDLLKRTAQFCTRNEPFLLSHINKVSVPKLSWILDAAAEFNYRHIEAILSTPSELILERAHNRIRRQLKIAAEKAYSEGGLDASEGKVRVRQYRLVIPVCEIGRNGNRKIQTFFYTEEQLQNLLSIKYVRDIIRDNPEKKSELLLAARCARREVESRKRYSATNGNHNKYREGHSRHKEPKGGIMIPAGVWIKPQPDNRSALPDSAKI